jgi:nitrogen fixation NifU-like protein
MEFWLSERDGTVERASFCAGGCAPSVACGSMATCMAVGKCLEDVLDMRPQEILEAFGEFPKESEHCALLALTALKAACEDLLRSHR